MSATPWVVHPRDDLSVLDVPFLAEKERENQCLVYCLAMTVKYVAKSYPDQWVRENMNILGPEEIRSSITINEQTGWVPDTEELEQVSEKAGPLNFEHVLRDQSPTKQIFGKIVKSHLNRDLPVIPIINAKMLRRDKRAGVHAVVATGMNEDQIAFHDPWGYPRDIKQRNEFINAWDDVLNQVITVTVGGQQTLSPQ